MTLVGGNLDSDNTVLVVDDNKVNVGIIRQMLRRRGFSVLTSDSGAEALAIARKIKPGIILLDIMMPDMDGFETCRRLKNDAATADIPIIFLSALDDTENKVHAFEVGGVDYITKPFQKNEVLARVDVHLRMRRLEMEQRRNIEELSELNEEKDKMMQIVSHDLRSPLGGIKGLAEILRDGEESSDPATVREFTAMICDSVESLIGLVNDLLDLAKIESGAMSLNFSRYEIRELVLRCIESIQMIALKKGVRIDMDFPDDEITVRGDRPKMMQVVNNLLSNAVKFTPHGRQVKVAVRLKSADTIEIVVADTGIGIPQSMMPNLFNKFGKHQREGTNGEKGTGLGMPIVKRFVELHGGTVHVVSEVDKGATFTITMPREADDSAAH